MRSSQSRFFRVRASRNIQERLVSGIFPSSTPGKSERSVVRSRSERYFAIGVLLAGRRRSMLFRSKRTFSSAVQHTQVHVQDGVAVVFRGSKRKGRTLRGGFVFTFG